MGCGASVRGGSKRNRGGMPRPFTDDGVAVVDTYILEVSPKPGPFQPQPGPMSMMTPIVISNVQPGCGLYFQAWMLLTRAASTFAEPIPLRIFT
jgi:hypothetical protein